ncbi:Seven transmembrane MLO family protein [Prunus dulcis]|uniref:Seven transmembrane MLO family protein n=1 Tax=Prunus dulcis TaxID=3755 RepID=A0A4Y1S0M8_PRUDU|nr:Seven transmembrane MLO family protein [Prunus dulcis]
MSKNYISTANVSLSHAAFLSNISKYCEPSSFEEANSQSVWKDAMREELQALDENCTWSIVKLPLGKRAVGCKWVYKTKFKSDGSLERHKAGFVAKGFTQAFGVDYKETFAPVAKMNTVRVLLSFVVNNDWPLFQMDVKNAFLYGELEEEVYMSLPPGHPQEKKRRYGLQVTQGYLWPYAITKSLRSSADSSLFVKDENGSKLIVLIYVDDIIITGSNLAKITKLKLFLHQKFAIKDLGSLKYFLGIEIAASRKGLFLNQGKYVLDLLKETRMMETKPIANPIDVKKKLGLEGELLLDVGCYQRLVGKLIYLTITRPDIAHVVSLVNQHMHAPRTTHLQAIKRILRYLKGSLGRGILMKKNGNTNIIGYSDADWAGCTVDRKSTTGYCTFVGGNLVTWKSKKQNVIARSSAEAEYRAMASLTCKLIWLRSLLNDLGFIDPEPMTLFCGNQAAIHIAVNPVFHE